MSLIELPSGNVFGCIATFRLVVKDFSGRAAEFTWFDPVEADVELLAILWVWEVGVGNDLTRVVVLALVFRAHEAILQFLLHLNAALAVRILGPHACAGVLVEVKSASTLVLDIFAINASVKHFADGRIRMGEEAVLAWAEIVLSLWCFCSILFKLSGELGYEIIVRLTQFCTIAAINIERLITLVDLSECWVED